MPLIDLLKRRPPRRAVLAAAVAAGAGSAGLGFLTGLNRHPVGNGYGAAAWHSPLHTERGRLAHLLRRATFGVSQQTLEQGLRDGLDRTVDRLLEQSAEPPGLVSTADPAQGSTLGLDVLQRWWLRHMLSTPAPFAERMTLFWHGHFTTEYAKVGYGSPFIYWQNLTWRRLRLARLGPMLRKVTIDPAMLQYLDLDGSDASDPDQPPNENYARELMELFTMGPGAYSEADVKAAARALAGWSSPPSESTVEVVVDEQTQAKEPVDVWSTPRPGFFNLGAAYAGNVTYLGRTGQLGLDQVIDQILARPATAPFLVRKLWHHFSSPAPSRGTVRRLADAFRTADYDLGVLMGSLLRSPEFFAPDSYRALVRSPVEFMVAAALAVGADPDAAAELIADYGEPAGQALFQPPNVGGWPGGARWISPGPMLARFNFVSALLDQVGAPASAENAADLHLDGVLSAATALRLHRASSDRERWLVVLTSPEFNLK
jgi:uncharacterized protein (DUF1800 family)